jgi:hypothetical protein
MTWPKVNYTDQRTLVVVAVFVLPVPSALIEIIVLYTRYIVSFDVISETRSIFIPALLDSKISVPLESPYQSRVSNCRLWSSPGEGCWDIACCTWREHTSGWLPGHLSLDSTLEYRQYHIFPSLK